MHRKTKEKLETKARERERERDKKVNTRGIQKLNPRKKKPCSDCSHMANANNNNKPPICIL
jgi:hypothetical protein